MIPMRIIETERDEFDEPVVELWRDDEFVGMVFWDGDTSVVQVYPDDDGDVKDLELGELLRVLDLAERIVSPVANEEEFADLRGSLAEDQTGDGDDDGWEDEHPATVALVEEFDPQAAHRSDDGEGFFPREVAEQLIRRCEELDLAVVEMEGFDLDGASLIPRPNLSLSVRVDGDTGWEVFRPATNARVDETLAGWPARSSLVLSFVVQQPDGETFVA